MHSVRVLALFGSSTVWPYRISRLESGCDYSSVCSERMGMRGAKIWNLVMVQCGLPTALRHWFDLLNFGRIIRIFRPELVRTSVASTRPLLKKSPGIVAPVKGPSWWRHSKFPCSCWRLDSLHSFPLRVFHVTGAVSSSANSLPPFLKSLTSPKHSGTSCRVTCLRVLTAGQCGRGCRSRGNVCFCVCTLREVNKPQLDAAVSKSRGSDLILLPLAAQTVGGMGVKLKYLIAPVTATLPPVGCLPPAPLLPWAP